MSAKISINNFNLVGRIIQFHRKKARLTRIELSAIAGVGKTVIYDIEHGKETIRLNTLLKICKALNLSLTIDGPLMDRFNEGQHA
jgi:transcriptional regulator with XRE-family HTH domain